MDQATGERIGWVAITAAAFGVGLLLGGRACAPHASPDGAASTAGAAVTSAALPPSDTPSPCPPQSPARVIYECPPPTPAEPSRRAPKAPPKKKREALPEPPPPLDPQARKRLLAWVRDQSDELKVCRDDGKDVYRVAVIMHVDAKSGVVKRVDVNASQGETPQELSACLQGIIKGWKPPDQLVQGRTELIFGLNL